MSTAAAEQSGCVCGQMTKSNRGGEKARDRGTVARPWHSSAPPSQRANTLTSCEQRAGKASQSYGISSVSPASPRSFKTINTVAEDLQRLMLSSQVVLKSKDPMESWQHVAANLWPETQLMPF